MATGIEVDAAQEPDQPMWDLDLGPEAGADWLGLDPAHEHRGLQLGEQRILLAGRKQLLSGRAVATAKQLIEHRKRPLFEKAEQRRVKRIERLSEAEPIPRWTDR
jgi:hypothetical protein